VICWPNRNGFYYVLDRVTGEFLVGTPFVAVTWAKGLTSTGRPILSDGAEIPAGGRRLSPGSEGGTNWQNPAFDPSRSSIFIPATVSSSVFTKLPADRAARTEPRSHQNFVGSGVSQQGSQVHKVLALDPASGAQKWEYVAPSGADLNGKARSGLLSTEGGLLFGASGGFIFALDADNGREVWRRSLGGTTQSPPISFQVDGRQVILVAAGRALLEFGL
jgi:alcohol dehydrogenase (cytochrome c)